MAILSDPTGANQAQVNSSGQLYTTWTTRQRTGVYIGHSGLLSVSATAHGATAGFLWLINPIGNTKLAALRRIELDQMGVAAAAAITRLTAERITFTGSFTGGQITPSKTDTTQPGNTALLCTNTTGLAVTAGAVMYGFLTMGIITAAGVAEPVISSWDPNEDGEPVIRPGEGVVIRQPDAGVATDPRRAVVNLAWEEW